MSLEIKSWEGKEKWSSEVGAKHIYDFKDWPKESTLKVKMITRLTGKKGICQLSIATKYLYREEGIR